MEVHAVGIDLGKTLFHLVGVNSSGSAVVRKRCSRSQLLAYSANLRVQRIGMEVCSGSHFLTAGPGQAVEGRFLRGVDLC
jgi:transposase